jgi:hypothetical protein
VNQSTPVADRSCTYVRPDQQRLREIVPRHRQQTSDDCDRTDGITAHAADLGPSYRFARSSARTTPTGAPDAHQNIQPVNRQAMS